MVYKLVPVDNVVSNGRHTFEHVVHEFISMPFAS
jgi:hypothetical protein